MNGFRTDNSIFVTIRTICTGCFYLHTYIVLHVGGINIDKLTSTSTLHTAVTCFANYFLIGGKLILDNDLITCTI